MSIINSQYHFQNAFGVKYCKSNKNIKRLSILREKMILELTCNLFIQHKFVKKNQRHLKIAYQAEFLSDTRDRKL